MLLPKRYTISARVIQREYSAFDYKERRRISIHPIPSFHGDYVKWEDVEEMVKSSPQWMEHQIDCLKNGVCPECGMPLKFTPPQGSFAPEGYATLREQGINTTTGHKSWCRWK